MMTKRFLLALSLALSAALPAAAGTFTLGYTDTTSPVTAHNTYGSTAITITDPTPVLGSSLAVSAGAFDVTVTSGSHGVAGLANTFAAFCLDIDHWLKLPSAYEATTTPFAGNLLSSAQKSAIKALFDTGYDAAKLTGAGKNAYSAGFQLALWEIVNETSGVFDLATGVFTASGSNAAQIAARNLANDLLAGNGGMTGNWRIVYLQSLDGPDGNRTQDSQNLVTVAPVPLPAAGAVLLLGLAVLGGLPHFRRKAA